ncbi:hypothetical protein CF645_16370 [Burkholderia pseudomallei]|nr:hypothetical protein CF640_12950 [Burkholderia pseudomallei]PNX21060.1 hypothetical protein CF645_16370 [Burkholderia pseudomallei]
MFSHARRDVRFAAQRMAVAGRRAAAPVTRMAHVPHVPHVPLVPLVPLVTLVTLARRTRARRASVRLFS